MTSRLLGNRSVVVSVVALSLLSTGPLARAERTGEDHRKDAEELEAKAKPELDQGNLRQARVIDEGKKNLEEIRRMLEEIQQDLADKKTGGATQDRQRKVVQRMDDLIRKIAEECQACNKGGQKSQQTSKKPQGGQRSKDPKDMESRENQKDVGSSRQEQEREQKRRQAQQQKEDDSPGKVPNTRVAEGELPDNSIGELVDQIQKGKKWGQLPPKVREAIFSAAAKPAPQEYRRIIQEYYLRISEQYARDREE